MSQPGFNPIGLGALNQREPMPTGYGSVMHLGNASRNLLAIEWVKAFEHGDQELEDAVCVIEVDIDRRTEKIIRFLDEITGEPQREKLVIRSGNGLLYWREMHLRSRWSLYREISGSHIPARDVEASFTDSEKDEYPGQGVALFKDRVVVFDCLGLEMYRERWELFRRKAARIQASFNLKAPEESVVTKFKSESQFWTWALSLRKLVDSGYFPRDIEYVCRGVGNWGIANLPTLAEIADSGKCPIEFPSEGLKSQYMRDMRCRAAVLEGGAAKYNQVPVHTEFTLGLRSDWDVTIPVPQIP